MVGCFVPHCKNNCDRKNKKVHFFRPKQDTAPYWVELMWKMKKNIAFDPNNHNHRVCHEHFEEECIDKAYTFLINGETVTLDKDRWRLHPGALPTLFPNLPVSKRPRVIKLRRKLNRNCDNQPQKKKRKNKESVKEEVPTPIKDEVVVREEEGTHKTAPSKQSSLCEHILNWCKEELPKSWVLDDGQKGLISLHHFCYKDKIPILVKSVIVTRGLDYSVMIRVAANGQDQSHRFWSGQGEVAVDSMNQFVTVFNEIKDKSMCIGIRGFDEIDVFKSGVKTGHVWHSTRCESIGNFLICTRCKLLHGSLLLRLSEVKGISATSKASS